MATLYTNELLPSSSEEAIRQFDERYRALRVKGAPDGWASRFVVGLPSPRVTFPLSEISSVFNETREFSDRTQEDLESTFDVKVAEYDAGHSVKVIDLLTNVFHAKNWAEAPSSLMLAEDNHLHTNLATLLEAGTSTTSPWDAVNFFSASHLADPWGRVSTTWSNYQSSTKDPASITNLTAEITAMKDVRGVDGKKLGVNPDEIWVPSEKFQYVSNLLAQNMINNGESNAMAGKLRVVEIKELTDTNDWFLVDSKLMSRLPAMMAANFVPGDTLGLRKFDESSDYFKQTGKIKVSAHIWYGFKLIFPHAIRLVKGA